MKNEIIKLFRNEVTGMYVSNDTIGEILDDKENHFISRIEDSKLIGVSVINRNTIYLLLVDKVYQRQGVGTFLLEESEKYIKSKGFNECKLGAGKEYIVPGVPMNENAHLFFKKHNYVHSWGDQQCIDLDISLDDFIYDKNIVGDIVDGILYRFATPDDVEGIVDCCKEDTSSFIEHYRNDSLYEPDSSDPVIVAEKDGEIVAALMIGVESGDAGIGYAGCIITAPSHRGKGIATTLLKIGTTHMKNMGRKRVWLSYTYTAIENTYKKLGYKICMEYFMGQKEL